MRRTAVGDTEEVNITTAYVSTISTVVLTIVSNSPHF